MSDLAPAKQSELAESLAHRRLMSWKLPAEVVAAAGSFTPFA